MKWCLKLLSEILRGKLLLVTLSYTLSEIYSKLDTHLYNPLRCGGGGA